MAKGQKKAGQKKRGAKDKWTLLNMDARLDMVKGWARQGALNQEIAEMLGISPELLYKWKREKPEFAEALVKGRHDADGELLNSAFRAASGYYITEVKKEPIEALVHNDDGEPVIDEQTGRPKTEVRMVITEEKTKWVKPDAQVLQFMLKNRLPDLYRERIEHEISGEAAVMFVDDIPDVPLVEGGDYDGDSEETEANADPGDKD